MNSIQLWEVLSDLKPEIVLKIDKIIIFGENGSEVIFSTSDGFVYGFGNNSFGGLGFGHKIAVKEAKMIDELTDKQIIDFSYGSEHVLAKTITGKLYSWGDNSYGQLGIETIRSYFRPKLIDSLSDKCVIAMSCGSYHSLVLTDDYQLYGFGYNINGQIGCQNTANQWKPIKIIGFNNESVVSISCGGWHSLALTQRGDVYSWGYNGWGQLGIGHKTDTNIPTKIVVNDRLVFKQIVCGYYHSLILSEWGDLYAFGFNTYGNLGTGDISHKSIPFKITQLGNVVNIGSHFWSDISMAKLKDNTYYVWGLCLGGNILKPKETYLKSFNDIMASHSRMKFTVKPIECKQSTNQSKQNNILDKISETFDDKHFSDFVFKIGDKEIFVNTFILRVNSDYFRNKSSNDSFDEIENIEVSDSYEVFYSYLKYLYTDCIDIENQYLDQLLILSITLKENDLTMRCTERIVSSDNAIPFENVVNLLKYSIDKKMDELSAKCIDRIKSMTTIGNICNVYDLSVNYGLNELKKICFEFMKGLNNKNIILNSDSYKKMSKDMKLEIWEKIV